MAEKAKLTTKDLLAKVFDLEAKAAERSAKGWQQAADAFDPANPENETLEHLRDEASFARGFACGWGSAKNLLDEVAL